ncbi:MAG TPA: PTS sugar transporter subunit IIA [Thermoanaerobaculia bacterium]|nr:PTS sugar transporter subunit IIA [Thermoanaerobaculia bacterium]
MGLGALTRPELIFPDLPATDRPGVLRALAERVAGQGLVNNGDELFQKLWEREQLGSTGIGQGVAIPHCKLNGLRQGVVAVGLVPAGVEFGAVDGQPVKVFFLVVSPGGSPAQHLQALAAISRWIKADGHAGRLLGLHDAARVYDLLRDEDG